MRTLFFSVLFGVAIPSEGQGSNWPPGDWRDSIATHASGHNPPYQSFRSYVLFRNGDTAEGMVRIRYDNFWGAFLRKGEFRDQTFLVKNVRYIKAHVPSMGSDYAELFTFDIKHMRRRFWRLIKKRHSISIFDRSTGIFTDGRIHQNNTWASLFNEHMVMMVGVKPIEIYGRFKSHNIVGIIKKDQSESLILKFINNRYQQNFTIQDFKSAMDMIDYILDHEHESN
jgi:hypothetical protein